MLDTAQDLLMDRFLDSDAVRQALPGVESAVKSGQLPPSIAARNLIRLYLQGEGK